MTSTVPSAEALLNGTSVQLTFSTDPASVSWLGPNSSLTGRVLLASDLLGFRFGVSTITLYTFAPLATGCLGHTARQRRDHHFEFKDDIIHGSWREALEAWLNSQNRPRRLLVLVNPKSGQGKAPRIYSKEVDPLFRAAGIELTVKETQYMRHATEIARDFDLSSIDGIVCVSGDGLPTEVLNGLLSRNGWKDAVRTPMGTIPAGSGNGLVRSTTYVEGEECSVASAAFSIIRGRSRPLDVATVSQGSQHVHSIVNINWGLVSDVDIESEKYRFLGGLRFTLQTLVRAINLRKYNGQLSYLPASSSPSDPVFSSQDEDGPFTGSFSSLASRESEWKVVDGEFILLWAQNIPWAAQDMHCTPRAQLDDGCLDILLVRDCSRTQLISLFLQMDNGTHTQSPHVEYLKVQGLRLRPGGRVQGDVQGGILAVDGEVVARGTGTVGNPNGDPMDYNEEFCVSVTKGLLRVFS